MNTKDIDEHDKLDKNFGLCMDDVLGPEYFVQDEFCSQYQSLPPRMSGAFVQLTKTGYYKSSWAVVSGNELYVY